MKNVLKDSSSKCSPQKKASMLLKCGVGNMESKRRTAKRRSGGMRLLRRILCGSRRYPRVFALLITW